MIDKDGILQKLTKGLANSLEENSKLREALEEILSNGYEVTIFRSPSNKDISIEIKRHSRLKFNLTHDDQVFLKSIKIKIDD